MLATCRIGRANCTHHVSDHAWPSKKQLNRGDAPPSMTHMAAPARVAQGSANPLDPPVLQLSAMSILSFNYQRGLSCPSIISDEYPVLQLSARSILSFNYRRGVSCPSMISAEYPVLQLSAPPARSILFSAEYPVLQLSARSMEYPRTSTRTV